ncbi:exported hypothetical protein [Aeromonas salmonicida]|nr:exported hypothetical protein [Aeromonas salmonicida]
MYCRASATESIKSCFLMMLISSSLVLVSAVVAEQGLPYEPCFGVIVSGDMPVGPIDNGVFVLKIPMPMIRLPPHTG